jgi:SAM-dependent methyltransferase
MSNQNPPVNHDSAHLQGELEGFKQNFYHFRRESIRNQIALYWRNIDYIESKHTQAEHLQCALCGYLSNQSTFKVFQTICSFGGGVLKRHQCPHCDVIFGAKKMLDLSEAELSHEYTLHYSVYEEGDSTAQEIRSFESLNPNKQGIYLNYGSGAWSKSVPLLRQAGWNVLGYEPHTAVNNVDWCISNPQQLAQFKFDGIFTNNVLEHFRHPANAIQVIATHLKPNGLLALTTPCYEYLYEYTRFHLYFFLGRSREVLIQQTGLNLVQFQQDGEFMNMVLAK